MATRVAMFVAGRGTNLTTEMTTSGGTTHAAAIQQRFNELESFAPDGVTVVQTDRDDPREEQLRVLREADAIVACFAAGPGGTGCGELIMELLPQLTRLRLVQLLSSGYDEYFSADDVVRLDRAGVTVANNGGANAAAVSETAVALAYAVHRGMVEMVNHVQRGEWRWDALRPGTELTGLTVGVVGFGNVGRQVARKMGGGFDCPVLFYDTDELPIGRAAELGAHAAPLDELLGRADIVVLCVPGIPATERLIGEKELGLMKRSAILVNVSRVSSHHNLPPPPLRASQTSQTVG